MSRARLTAVTVPLKPPPMMTTRFKGFDPIHEVLALVVAVGIHNNGETEFSFALVFGVVNCPVQQIYAKPGVAAIRWTLCVRLEFLRLLMMAIAMA